MLTIFLIFGRRLLARCPFCWPGQDSEQIVSILLSIFLFGTGCLLLCRQCFPTVVFANEEVDLVRAFFFQVVEGARVVNGK